MRRQVQTLPVPGKPDAAGLRMSFPRAQCLTSSATLQTGSFKLHEYSRGLKPAARIRITSYDSCNAGLARRSEGTQEQGIVVPIDATVAVEVRAIALVAGSCSIQSGEAI